VADVRGRVCMQGQRWWLWGGHGGGLASVAVVHAGHPFPGAPAGWRSLSPAGSLVHSSDFPLVMRRRRAQGGPMTTSAELPEESPDRDGAAGANTAPPMTIDVLLRAARHRADLSQRELAERAGVNRSMVSRIEAGLVVSPGFPLVTRLLTAAGCRLLALDENDEPLTPRPFDDALDAGRRHYPAHLDVRPVRGPGDWWFGYQRPAGSPLPRYTTDGRTRRDSRRFWAEPQRRNTPPAPPLSPERGDDG
jgi:transcriptional regulator with XRE-family HTH domain